MRRVRQGFYVVVIAGCCVAASSVPESPTAPAPPPAPSPHMLYQEGLFQEVVQGDLAGATAVYQQVASNSENRLLAGLASMRTGECYEKMGQSDRAFELYAELPRRFRELDQLREAVARKFFLRSGPAGQRLWYLTRKDGLALLRYIDLRPYAEDGKRLGLQVHWTQKAPAGGSAYGLRAGDVVTEVNGLSLRSLDAMLKVIALLKTGDSFQVKVRRGQEEQLLEYKLSDTTPSPQP